MIRYIIQCDYLWICILHVQAEIVNKTFMLNITKKSYEKNQQLYHRKNHRLRNIEKSGIFNRRGGGSNAEDRGKQHL